MRWKQNEKGDQRVRRRFLVLPKSIGGEVRWLEVASWKEEFFELYGPNGYWSEWLGTEWVDA